MIFVPTIVAGVLVAAVSFCFLRRARREMQEEALFRHYSDEEE